MTVAPKFGGVHDRPRHGLDIVDLCPRLRVLVTGVGVLEAEGLAGLADRDDVDIRRDSAIGVGGLRRRRCRGRCRRRRFGRVEWTRRALVVDADDMPTAGIARNRHRASAVVGGRRLSGSRRRSGWSLRCSWSLRCRRCRRRPERSGSRRFGLGLGRRRRHHRHRLRQRRQRHRLRRGRFGRRLGGGNGDRLARCRGRRGCAAGRRRPDHRRHDGAVRVAIRQSVAGHDVVPAGDQVLEPGVWGYAGVDHGDLLPGATPELPRLLQVQHVHVLRLQPKVGTGQDPDLGAVRVLLHRRRRSGRTVGRHRGRINRRR